MAQIRDTNIIRTPEVTVDPRLFVPDGVIDMKVRSSEIDPDAPVAVPIDGVLVDDLAEQEVSYEEPPTDIGEGGFEDNSLPTPQYVLVLNQQVRFAPDGKALVDVTIEIEDVPGITNYEVRVAKV